MFYVLAFTPRLTFGLNMRLRNLYALLCSSSAVQVAARFVAVALLVFCALKSHPAASASLGLVWWRAEISAAQINTPMSKTLGEECGEVSSA